MPFEINSLDKCLRRIHAIFHRIQENPMDRNFRKAFQGFCSVHKNALSERSADSRSSYRMLQDFFRLAEYGDEHFYTSNPYKIARSGLTPVLGAKDDHKSPLYNKNMVIGLSVISPITLCTSKSVEYEVLSYRVDFDDTNHLHINLNLFNVNLHCRVHAASTRFTIFPEASNCAEKIKFKFWLKMTLAFYPRISSLGYHDLISFFLNGKDTVIFRQSFIDKLEAEYVSVPDDLFDNDRTFTLYLSSYSQIRHAFIDTMVEMLSTRRLTETQPVIAENSETSAEQSSESPPCRRRGTR